MFEVFEYARKVSNVDSQVYLHSFKLVLSQCVIYVFLFDEMHMGIQSKKLYFIRQMFSVHNT